MRLLFAKLISILYYSMTFCKCNKKFENIHIIYEGGEMSMTYRKYNQTFKLFKKDNHYGSDKVVISSSGWYEYEYTIKKNTSEYFCMRTNGSFILVGKPENYTTCDADCVIVRITNLENVD
jgi:hypothetical protein